MATQTPKSGHSNKQKDTYKVAPPTTVTPSTIIETSQATTATTPLVAMPTTETTTDAEHNSNTNNRAIGKNG